MEAVGPSRVSVARGGNRDGTGPVFWTGLEERTRRSRVPRAAGRCYLCPIRGIGLYDRGHFSSVGNRGPFSGAPGNDRSTNDTATGGLSCSDHDTRVVTRACPRTCTDIAARASTWARQDGDPATLTRSVAAGRGGNPGAGSWSGLRKHTRHPDRLTPVSHPSGGVCPPRQRARSRPAAALPRVHRHARGRGSLPGIGRRISRSPSGGTAHGPRSCGWIRGGPGAGNSPATAGACRIPEPSSGTRRPTDHHTLNGVCIQVGPE